MSKLTVRTCRMERVEHGRRAERVILLVHGPLGLPYIPAADYMLSRLRAAGHKPATMRHSLRAVALALEFLAEQGIDLHKQVAQKKYLSRAQLIALSDRCRITEYGGELRLVNQHYAKTRYATCIDYIEWIAEPIIARTANAKEHAAAEAALERFKRRAKSVAPRANSADMSTDEDGSPAGRVGMLPAQRELFLRVIQPGDPGNPYSPILQVRNHAMLRIFFDLGPRVGELMGFKCKDLKVTTDPPILMLHRRHDDGEDEREKEAATKTTARVLPLSDDLCELLDDWITNHRSDRTNFPRARLHGYIFVNDDGDPITDDGVRYIVSVLQEKYPELAPLFPHRLRHDWNDRWNEEYPTTDSNEAALNLKEQRYLMGWSNNSIMHFRYGLRSIQESANKKILEMQEKSLRSKKTTPGSS